MILWVFVKLSLPSMILDLPVGICLLFQLNFCLLLFRTAIPHCAIPCCFSARTQLITNHIALSFAFCLDISKNIQLNHRWMSICKEIASCNGDIALTISLRLCYADIAYILFIYLRAFRGWNPQRSSPAIFSRISSWENYFASRNCQNEQVRAWHYYFNMSEFQHTIEELIN